MDLSLNVYKVPERGETVTDDGGVAYTPGGKGANAAVAFKKLGADCALCARLGADHHGQMLYKYYCDMGLDTSLIKVDRDYPTGLAVVIKEGDGQNRIIHYQGANAHISNDNLISAFNSSRPDAVFLNFEVSFATALAAAKIATVKKIPIFIDAAPADRAQSLEALPPVEIFSPNEAETYAYTGINPQGMESTTRAALALFRRVKCKYLVIKQGARGACIYDGKRITTVPACKAEKVVDTTAAGDTFTAAMTVEYLRTGDIKAAVKYGTVAAAIAISRNGATTSVPTADEVRRYMLSRGY